MTVCAVVQIDGLPTASALTMFYWPGASVVWSFDLLSALLTISPEDVLLGNKLKYIWLSQTVAIVMDWCGFPFSVKVVPVINGPLIVSDWFMQVDLDSFQASTNAAQQCGVLCVWFIFTKSISNRSRPLMVSTCTCCLCVFLYRPESDECACKLIHEQMGGHGRVNWMHTTNIDMCTKLYV